MDKMSGIAKSMPTIFALFTIGSMASLALPGMSGFVSELTVFMGLTASDVYSSPFKVVTICLAAVGVILTPIYLLSMLRQVFFGKEQGEFGDSLLKDANPREIFITACLLLPIIGIGLYPKLATQTYDVTAVALAAQVREALPSTIAVQPTSLYAQTFAAPTLAGSPRSQVAALATQN
jgi:NAD(P)H-quinone oxidoreductase subunit 4